MLKFSTYYHICNHANGFENIFREEENYHFFLDKMQLHIEPVVEIIAWRLMPNHFYFIVKVRSEAEIIENYSSSSSLSFQKFRTLENLDNIDGDEKIKEEKYKFISKQFSNFFSSYTLAFNKMYKRRGSLFIKTFKRKEIDSKTYLRNLILYVHLNPVNHGFTSLHTDWEWNSFETFPVHQEERMKMLFTDYESYRKAHVSQLKNMYDFDSDLD